ncbi:MAG: AI-2E family transporter [Nitrospirota bacterium]|nr:AI-2E family transporter [Nitrospirota bacterium]
MNALDVNAATDVTPEPQPLPDPAHLTTRVSLNVRGLALTIVTAVVVVFALQWAEKFFVPLLLGIFIAYTLNPLVVWLERIKIPRMLGTSLVMLTILCGSAFVAFSLRDQAQTILDQLPVAASKLSTALLPKRGGQPNTMQNVQAAAREFDNATSQAGDIHSSPKQAATHLVIDQPVFKLGDFLKAGSMKLVTFIGQSTMVLILVFFLLLADDTFKHKLVHLVGPSLSDKKITVHLLDDINSSIQRYMFTLLVSNVLLALLTWTAFRWIGLENAGGWAIAAGGLHVIPYLGPALIAVMTGMAAFLQFDSFWMVLLVSASSLAIATFVGIFVVTWMTGKFASMNAVSVFIALLFWGWLWGAWGLLLAIPIMCIVKVVSEHIEELQPLAELLRK